MSEPAQPDPLQPALNKVQAELAKHLDIACEVQPEDISHGSVDELLHLEEELLAAARAADEAVRLRQRLGERASADKGAPRSHRVADTEPPVEGGGGRVREFQDRQGVAWRVWEVRPGLGRPLSELHRYLGAYLNGWLAFGSLDSDVRKRLPKFPPDWLRMGDQELEALLLQASEVPQKKKGRG